MTKDDVLMLMEMTARAEREAGFGGYGSPPDHLLDVCRDLVSEGLAEEGEPGRFRPTKDGADRVAHRIHAVQ